MAREPEDFDAVPFDDPEVRARDAVLGADFDDERDDAAFDREVPDDFVPDDFVPDDLVPEDLVPDDDERDELPDDAARDDERDDFVPDDERDDDERDEDDRDDALAGERSSFGTSSLMTSLTSCGICLAMKLCIRSSWRRNSFASFTVSLSPSWSATASITL